MSNNSREWIPHKKQVEFLSLPYSIKEAFYGGGAGSAKTETLLMYPIIHRFHENSRFKQVLLRRTFPELRNEVVPRSKLLYRPFKAEFNKAEMTWHFPSGAVVLLGHCENIDDIHKYDSMEINLFTPDELTSLEEFQYLYIAFTRVRSSDRNLPAIVRAAGMPGGIGHTWVKKRFVDPASPGTVINGKGGNKRIYIHATLADNPYIDPNYKQSLEALPEAEKSAKLYGNWNSYLGQVFEEFRDRHYPDEPSNALHVIEPIDIPSYWPKLVSIDWGFAPPAMTYICYGMVSPDKRLIVYREQSFQKTKIEEWCAIAREYIDRENPRQIKICKSAGQDRGQEHTILQQVESALDRSVELTSNTAGSRVAGKMLLHEYFRWKSKTISNKMQLPYNHEYAEWLLRNRTDKEYKSYLESFVPPEEESNLPKLLIFNTCPLLINAIKACSYDKNNPEDVAQFGGDDPFDAVRYLVDAADRYFNDSVNEFNKIQRQAALAEEFEVTGDWNRLFQRARVMESQDKTFAIRRYHHR